MKNNKEFIKDEIELKSYLDSSSNSSANKEKNYIEEVAKRFEEELSSTLEKEIISAGSMNKNPSKPHEILKDGRVRGEWDGNVFIFDDNYIPKNVKGINPQGLTIKEIKEELQKKYDITFDGIPFDNNVADFREISVASISTQEIITAVTGMSKSEYDALSSMKKTEVMESVFTKENRNRNFEEACKIAAKKQIPIPGLSKENNGKYTYTDLQDWAKENKFSWDEQVRYGYNLVPSVIHSRVSIPHDGSVSTSSKARKNIEQYQTDLKNNPEKYSFDESNAPISISELKQRSKTTNDKSSSGSIGGNGSAKIINDKNYSDMIDSLMSFSRNMKKHCSDMKSLFNICKTVLGDEDVATKGILNEINASILKYEKASKKAEEVANIMSLELENAKKEKW